MTHTHRPKRSGRRGRRKEGTNRRNAFRLPYLRNRLDFLNLLDEEELDRVHNGSMNVLEKIGIAFRDEEALRQWRMAGARVVGDTVYPDRAMIMELVEKAPAEFEMASRSPDRRVRIGGRNAVFSPMQGAPNVRDLDGVRRQSTLEDLNNFNKLTQMASCQHIAGGFIVEANDLPVPHRHLEWIRSNLLYTDMPFFGATTAPGRAQDGIEMARIVHGEKFLERNALLICQVSGNSPRLWDETMLSAARVHADANQVALLSPFVLACANAPADVAGTLVQLNAEALAGIAYMQLYKPGTKCIYGQYTVSTSLKSGAPMAGTPEIALVNYAVGQLARRYDIPWRTTGSQASSKLFDAQSGYESAPGMMTAITAGANLILHAGGWDEAGLVNCYAKFIVDCEQNCLYHRLAQGISFGRLDEAIDAISKVRPSGHYLGEPFTIKYFKDSFVMPERFDYSSHPQWLAEGGNDAAARARAYARELLESYVEPVMEQATREELDSFVERRKMEIPPSIV